MGLLSDEKALSESDYKNGHRRVYDMEWFKRDFTSVGLEVIESGGFWIKPLSDAQIAQSWNEQMIDAFFKLGEQYPDIAADIYIVARKHK